MLSCSQRALILVHEQVVISALDCRLVAAAMFVRSNVKPLCHRMTGVSKMYV